MVFLSIPKIILVICVGMALLSCQSRTAKAGYRIEQDKLIEMIIDYQVAKAATFKYPVDMRDSMMKVYEQQIFEIHGVDPYAFEHDMNKLESEPEYFKEIYDQVKLRMEPDNSSGER
jgi:hypothetical protein